MSKLFKYYDTINVNSLKVHLITYLIISSNYFILGELAFTFNTTSKTQKYWIFLKCYKYFIFKLNNNWWIQI
jgi:hypothetical protein